MGRNKLSVGILLLTAVFLFASCGSAQPGFEVKTNNTLSQDRNSSQPAEQQGDTRDNTPVVPTPLADGGTVYEEKDAVVDASHLSDGYVMVKYTGQAEKAKAQITTPNGIIYTYTLREDFNVLPLTEGNGTYQVAVFGHVVDDQYAVALKQELGVALANEFSPFLSPNQYVNFSADSETVLKAQSLSESAASDLEVVANVYHYIIENVAYDDEKAQQVSEGKLKGYLPDVDEILKLNKGICFDYAALMTAMLRSQQIPTKMEIGYSGEAYHAWISTYIQDIGWIDNIIEFDGQSWKLMDPTYAANSGGKQSVMEYIGDGTNYTTQFTY